MSDSYRLEAILALKDEYSDKMQNIANKAKKFKAEAEKIKPVVEMKDKATKDINKITSNLKKLKGLKNVIDVKAKDNASKTIQKIKGKMSLLKFKAIALNVKDKASGILGKVGSKLKSVSQKWTSKIGVKDGASAILGKIKGLLAVLAVGTVIKVAIQNAGQLEQQMVSMEHFMGVGNKGKSKGEIHKMTGDYTKFLKGNANATPYSTNDVMTAGTRSLTIAQGNTSQAKKLLTLAEDMAAADPNKTLGDAVEAIADAQMGEFERMKEFGFKGSKESFDKADKDFFKMKDQNGRTVNDTFGGLAQKQSGTAMGKWSTITGNMETAQTSFGSGILQGMSPTLDKIGQKIEKMLGSEESQNRFMQFGQQVGNVFNGILTVATAVGNGVKWAFEQFASAVDFNAIASAFAPIGGLLQSFFTNIQVLAPVASFVLKALGFAFTVVATAIGVVLQLIAMWLKAFAENIRNTIEKGKAIVSSFPQVWQQVKSAVSGFVNGIKQKIDSFVSGIVGGINRAKRTITSLGDAWKTLKSKIENNPIVQTIKRITKGDDEDGRLAWGLNRVPYNGYHARLHEGERVLTKNEANQMDRGASGGLTVNMYGITIREEADIDKILKGLVKEWKLAKGGV